LDGIHDLGGKHGFGSIVCERDEPVFHERWEAKVFAIMLAAGRAGAYRNADQFRHAIERIDPVAYLTHGYYGRWLGGMETLLVEAGLVDVEELNRRARAAGADQDAVIAARPSSSPQRVDYDNPDRSSYRHLQSTPRFRVGDAVRCVSTPSDGHTRLPAYARGRPGTIQSWHDGWILPDSNAHGHGENPQHLYTVSFAGEDLWGKAAEPAVIVSLDLFEPYLEALPVYE
jgi:nitrile hydratase beta subunit